MENYVVTKEQLLKAKTYLTLEEKEAILNKADLCFDRLSITAGDEAMPHMWKENYGLKARYMMGALLTYLRVPFEHESDEMLITVEDYDKFASAHVVMQIERFKRDKDENIRNKAYNLLSDYFELARMFSTEIAEMLAVQNDPVLRQKMISDEIVKKLPETMEQIKVLLNSQNAEAVLNGS